MALKKIRIGDFVELVKIKCNNPNLTIFDVSGINRDKEFFEPSKQVGTDTSDYKIVPPGHFACNLMHIGRDIVLPIALNTTAKNKIVSPAYHVFKFKNEDFILKDFFFIFLKSNEKDRFFWFHCDSSVRDGMDWEVFCDIELELPSIEIQKKYLAIYEALLDNLQSYEHGLEELKISSELALLKLKKEYLIEPIGKYIYIKNDRNIDLAVTNVEGVKKDKTFIPTIANMNGIDLSNYKVVSAGDFAYSNRINIGSIALKREGKCVVSPSYTVFGVKEGLLPEYLLMWFCRDEFLHYAFYYSMGTVKDELDFEELAQMSIPVPPIEIQKKVIAISNIYFKRTEYVSKLKEKIQNICPILIAGSIKEARGE